MQKPPRNNVTTLAMPPTLDKAKCLPDKRLLKNAQKNKDTDFIETLFRFLGAKRRIVSSFLVMKLGPEKRKLFLEELNRCKNPRQEGRCLKKYICLLSLNDASSLLMSLPEMLPGKIEALSYHGESCPENRLKKFAKNFDLSDHEVFYCMLFFLISRSHHHMPNH